jgi:cobalt/nickel transport system permease protein
VSRLDVALQDLRALDALALRDTALARRDPRAKLALTLCFVLTVLSFGRYQVAALLPLALFPAVLSAQAQMPARLLRRTLWLAAPFALTVGLANPWFDRSPMLALGGVELSAGWVSFGSIVLRVTLTVSATLLLLGSTGMPALCAALSRWGVPRVLTAQLLFLQRYIHVLAEEALRMSTAHRLRAAPGRRLTLPLFGSLMGQLLLRAFDRAARVHQAMLARGFDGQLRPADGWRWQRTDTLFVGLWCSYFVLARAVDLPLLLGRLLTGASAGPWA